VRRLKKYFHKTGCRAYFLENPLAFQLTMARMVFYENMPAPLYLFALR
jgi:hypothetical protein